MGSFTLTAQDVNGDPATSGSNINIVNGSFSDLEFVDVDDLLGVVQTGEYVVLNGVQYSYEFLGYGDVRNDPNQLAGFVRIDLADGTFLTVAIDMDADGDGIPNLSNGNTKLTVASLDTTTSEPFPVPLCFTLGTLIDTPSGPRKIETLEPGDLVCTFDGDAKPVVSVLFTETPGIGKFAPVKIQAGALGNTRALQVSPQHRMLMCGWESELWFGEFEVLVAAKDLVGRPGITRAPVRRVTYVHLVLEAHEIVFAEGIPSESFFVGGTVAQNNPEIFTELQTLFPELSENQSFFAETARTVVKGREAGAALSVK